MTQNMYIQESPKFVSEISKYKAEVDEFLEKASNPDMKKISEIAQQAYKEHKIPKIIHFCYINYKHLDNCYYYVLHSWMEHLSDYTFINWTPKNLPTNNWLEQCLKNHKWAAYADYARIYGVYNIGGFYMDCDVISYKSFDDLLDLPYVIDLEYSSLVDPLFIMRLEAGVFGAQAHIPFMKYIKGFYEAQTQEFEPDDYLRYIAPTLWGRICQAFNYDFAWMQNLETMRLYSQTYDKNDHIILVLNGSYFSRTNTKAVNNFGLAKQIGIEELRIEPYAYTSHQMFSKWLAPDDTINN